MKKRIIALCYAAMVEAGAVCMGITKFRFVAGLANGREYTVTLTDVDVDEDDDLPSAPLPQLRRHDGPVENHVHVLDVCLHAVSADPECRRAISDLSTDGDGSDCEAIFQTAAEGWLALKVR